MLRLLRPKTDLRTLITLLAVASIVITLANSLYAAWRVQREQLITNTLEANRVYAAKLAATTGQFFQQAQLQLPGLPLRLARILTMRRCYRRKWSDCGSKPTALTRWRLSTLAAGCAPYRRNR